MQELFNNGTIVVTETTFRNGAQSYPIRAIIKVTDFKMPMEIKNLLINGGFAFLGLMALTKFSTGWVIVGLIGLGIGGYNCYDILTRKHFMVIVDFTNGESLHLDFPDVDSAIYFRDSLHHAMSLN